MQNISDIAITKSKRIKAGITAGLVGGLFFAVLASAFGTLPLALIAKLLGGSSLILGFFMHLAFGVIIALFFSLSLGYAAINKARSVALGLFYGLIWWFLGPLIIMPAWLGMGIQLSAQGMRTALPSLWGHLVYGFTMGLVYYTVTVYRNHTPAQRELLTERTESSLVK